MIIKKIRNKIKIKLKDKTKIINIFCINIIRF